MSDFARYAPKLIALPFVFPVGEFIGRWIGGDEAPQQAFALSNFLWWTVFLLPVVLVLFAVSNVFPRLLSDRIPMRIAQLRAGLFGEVDR